MVVTSGTPLWSRKVEKAGATSRPEAEPTACRKSAAVAFFQEWRFR
jgi:hypothetical protein